VNDATDAYGRTYAFGQKYARIDDPNSLEGRAGISARKRITLKSGKTLQPSLSLAWLNDFKGDMTITSVNETKFHDDLGGGTFQVDIGLSTQLGKGFSAMIDAALQNGGKVDGYSINAGINFHW
jgi:outer membrane autotransporter protein